MIKFRDFINESTEENISYVIDGEEVTITIDGNKWNDVGGNVGKEVRTARLDLEMLTALSIVNTRKNAEFKDLDGKNIFSRAENGFGGSVLIQHTNEKGQEKGGSRRFTKKIGVYFKDIIKEYKKLNKASKSKGPKGIGFKIVDFEGTKEKRAYISDEISKVNFDLIKGSLIKDIEKQTKLVVSNITTPKANIEKGAIIYIEGLEDSDISKIEKPRLHAAFSTGSGRMLQGSIFIELKAV